MTYSARAADGAIRENLTVPQGAAWTRTWAVSAPDGGSLLLDGWDARAQVRAIAEADEVLFEWSTVTDDEQTGVVLDHTAVTLALTGFESRDWAWRRGVYDLYLFDPNGVPTRLVEGTVTVSPSVTR